MKFILDKDKLTIENTEMPNSGSVEYYEAEVEYDESWEGLTIKAVIVPKEYDAYEEEGKEIAVINNKFFIDSKLCGLYGVGFVGYTVKNNEKTYQISSHLVNIRFVKGAGEIETSEEDVPTPSQWEIYIAQIQAMLDSYSGVPAGGTAGQVLTKKSNVDRDVEWKEPQGGGVSNHNELNNLDYEHSGHTGFQPAGNYALKSEIPDVSQLYAKPSGGIPKTDLANDVQTVINNPTKQSPVYYPTVITDEDDSIDIEFTDEEIQEIIQNKWQILRIDISGDENVLYDVTKLVLLDDKETEDGEINLNYFYVVSTNERIGQIALYFEKKLQYDENENEEFVYSQRCSIGETMFSDFSKVMTIKPSVFDPESGNIEMEQSDIDAVFNKRPEFLHIITEETDEEDEEETSEEIYLFSILYENDDEITYALSLISEEGSDIIAVVFIRDYDSETGEETHNVQAVEIGTDFTHFIKISDHIQPDVFDVDDGTLTMSSSDAQDIFENGYDIIVLKDTYAHPYRFNRLSYFIDGESIEGVYTTVYHLVYNMTLKINNSAFYYELDVRKLGDENSDYTAVLTKTALNGGGGSSPTVSNNTLIFS